MAKKTTAFICNECQHQESRWLGRCPVTIFPVLTVRENGDRSFTSRNCTRALEADW